MFLFDLAIACFEYYLFNRSFRVSIKNEFSNDANTNCDDVRERYLSEPLQLLLHVNEKCHVVDCYLFVYADGSCLVKKHRDIKEIEQKLNKIILNDSDCLVDNKLSIHFEKYRNDTIPASKYRLNNTKKQHILFAR